MLLVGHDGRADRTAWDGPWRSTGRTRTHLYSSLHVYKGSQIIRQALFTGGREKQRLGAILIPSYVKSILTPNVYQLPCDSNCWPQETT